VSEFVPVIRTGDLAEGAMKIVRAGGQAILIARINGTYHAVDNRCPHAGGNLSDGQLTGNIVTCPLHGSQWDVTTGQVVRWLRSAGAVPKVTNITVYPVKVEGENILVAV
jgi:nitrite reductase/ring-hydroxylating ferredoxin subunit